MKLTTVLLSISLAACTSVPKDGGVSAVEKLLVEQLEPEIQLPAVDREPQYSEEQIAQMLQQPITLANAEKLSVAKNPAVKVKLYQVGVAEADYAQAGRMENPGFTYERYAGDEYSASLLFDIGGLVLMPLKRTLQLRRLSAARYQAAAGVLQHVADTRKAWIKAVAEKQKTVLLSKALDSADVGNNLTRQMSALGHSNVIEAADSEIFLSEMRASLSRQRLAEGVAREALIRKLGLWGRQARDIKLPDSLPDLPVNPIELESVEREAIENRLDVKMATMNLEGTAANLKLTRLNPFFSAIELGPKLEKSGSETERGFELEFRIPIFDAGGIKNEKARTVFLQAQAQAEVTAIGAASNAREALAAYRSSYDIAQHYRDVILPLRQRVSAEQLLMYNGMLISVFDLLDDLRSALGQQSAYIDAVKTFWLADANLQQALSGSGMAGMNFEGSSMMPSADADGGGH
jgi:outer membrane protein TolC